MNKVVEKSAEKVKTEPPQAKVEEAPAEEKVVDAYTVVPADPFLNRKAARLAAVQQQVDGPKPVVTSDVTEEETEDKEETK